MKKFILILIIFIVFFSCKKTPHSGQTNKIEVVFDSIREHGNKTFLIFYKNNIKEIWRLSSDGVFFLFDGLKKGDKFYLKKNYNSYNFIYKRLVTVDNLLNANQSFTPLKTPQPEINIENHGEVNIYMEENNE